MPLFTDSDIVCTADLRQIDGEIEAVANSFKPRIVIEGGGSICEQAWRESGAKIIAAQQMYGTYCGQSGITSAHNAAVNCTGLSGGNQPRVRLNQIVAHGPNYSNSKSQLEMWLRYSALWLFYRDASARMDKDRYETKMDRYRAQASSAWQMLRTIGLPVVWSPMDAPGAKYSYRPGSWDAAANIGSASGGASAEQFVSVAVTWYDASRYTSQANDGNAESGPSPQLSFTIPAASYLTVTISSLNPPNGTQDPVGISQGNLTPLNATHWNIWAGRGDGNLYLQHEGIPIGTKSYTLAGVPIFTGALMGRGQYPDRLLTFQNIVMAG